MDFNKTSEFTNTFVTSQANDITTQGETPLCNRFSTATKIFKPTSSTARDLPVFGQKRAFNLSNVESCEATNLTGTQGGSTNRSLWGKHSSKNKTNSQRNLFERSLPKQSTTLRAGVPVYEIDIDSSKNKNNA